MGDDAQTDVADADNARHSPTTAGQREFEYAQAPVPRSHAPPATSSSLPADTATSIPPHQNSTFPDPFHASPVFHVRQPSTAGLSIYTGTAEPARDGLLPGNGHSQHGLGGDIRPRKSSSLSRPSVSGRRSYEGSNVMSPASSISSPMLAGLADVTPLPSPIFPPDSPDFWKRIAERANRSRGNSAASVAREDALLGPSALGSSPSRKKKPYHGLRVATDSPGSSTDIPSSGNRSTSEYTPEALQNLRPRHVTLPAADVLAAADMQLRNEASPLVREKDFSERHHRQRHEQEESTAPPATEPLPTPPPSDKSTTDSEESNELKDQIGPLNIYITKHEQRRDFVPIRRIGSGAFSQVVLASDRTNAASPDLCAIKVVDHDPRAKDDERMEASIKREIEMLQKLSHPSLPRILGSEDTPTRALVALAYCQGGDLFDLAAQRRDLLTPRMLQRIFAELVDAVSYLHKLNIVHRDIKLENVLCNVAIPELEKIPDVRLHSTSIITLTDLGLSRSIDPASPLLTHPCGSTDYAAPELLLGQAYDGRSTDAWALGVLLYALLEGRLPFDPLPGKRNTGNVKHRIARCDWLWCVYGDQHGDWVEQKGLDIQGAREVVEGLLKKAGRGRWSLEKVREHAWVQQGIQVDGGPGHF